MFQEFPYHLNVNATLQCKYNTQRILSPGDLNWVQHWVSRIGLFCKTEIKTDIGGEKKRNKRRIYGSKTGQAESGWKIHSRGSFIYVSDILYISMYICMSVFTTSF